MNRTITITRRSIAVIATLAIVATVVSAAVLSNFQIPSTATVTSAPGITVYQSDGTTIIGSIAFGDIQVGSTAQTHQIIVKNTGGSLNQYLIDNANGAITGVPTSLTFSGVPSNVALTWNFASVYSTPVGCGAVSYPCALMSPSQASQVLTLSLQANAGATPGPISFTITIQAFTTASG